MKQAGLALLEQRVPEPSPLAPFTAASTTLLPLMPGAGAVGEHFGNRVESSRGTWSVNVRFLSKKCTESIQSAFF